MTRILSAMIVAANVTSMEREITEALMAINRAATHAEIAGNLRLAKKLRRRHRALLDLRGQERSRTFGETYGASAATVAKCIRA